MIEEEIIIQNKLGLHARAANKLVDVTSQFASEISLTLNDKQVDAKSIMSVMLLAAAKGSQGDAARSVLARSSHRTQCTARSNVNCKPVQTAAHSTRQAGRTHGVLSNQLLRSASQRLNHSIARRVRKRQINGPPQPQRAEPPCPD